MNESKIVLSRAFALLLIFAIALPIVAMQTTSAQNSNVKTYPFINATPNPVQVGTETLLHLGITRPLLFATQGWTGLTVTVTKPDNTTQTLGPFTTDSTGGTGTVLVPDEVGIYYLQTNFPAQWFNYTGSDGRGGQVSVSVYAEAGTSEKIPLTVQEEPLQYWPGVPLPTEYWSRPIDSQAREWNTISGSWLDTNRRNPSYMPYNNGPETAHVLWTRQETTGGLVGGALDNALTLSDNSYEMGDAYEGKFSSRLIIDGKLIYNVYAGPSIGAVDNRREYACIDIHTGELLWSRVLLNNLTLSRGQTMYWDTYDFHGVYDYIWATAGSTWYAFDPFNGDLVYTLTNVPSGTVTYGPKGEILIYTINLRQGWMTLWNSTNIPELYANTEAGSMGFAQWRPYQKTIDAQEPISTPFNPIGLTGYMWNKTIPTASVGSVNYIYPTDRAICTDLVTPFPGPVSNSVTEITSWAIDLSIGHEGAQLFKETWTAPASWVEGNQTVVFEAVSPQSTNGVFVLGARDNRQHYGFSTETGKYLWVTEPEIYLNWYGAGGIGGERPPQIAYDTLMTTGIGGIIYAYDTTTGQRIWTYNATDDYQETLFANNWWMYPVFITDGKIYYGSLEHSPVNPIPRGAPFLALDVKTGQEVFRVNGMFRQTLWGGLAIIGDSIITTQDTYDCRIYAIGKGPSATTLSAPNSGVKLGDSIVLSGTVSDISPGTNDATLTMRFPNGVPAVSDASMSDWMLYVYKQFARPMNALGVDVTLSVIDSNGNFREIGSATTTDGFFALNWKPDIEGQYTVYANFNGTESYYPSYALASFTVDPAPTSQQSTQTPGNNDTVMAITYAAIAIIIVIILVGVVLVLLLRRRP